MTHNRTSQHRNQNNRTGHHDRDVMNNRTSQHRNQNVMTHNRTSQHRNHRT